MKKLLSNLPRLVKLTYQGWKEDRASRLSAALAYYTIFSLAPMLVIVIAITGLIWEAGAIRTLILDQVRGLVGAAGSDLIAGLITRTGTPGQDALATVIGLLTLLYGALGVFNQLHDSLNIIWDVKDEPGHGFWTSVKRVVIDRLLSFTMILGVGFLLLVSLVISTGLSAAQESLAAVLPFSEVILQLINLVISVAVITVLFALMFKFLPDARIAWRDVWLGAFVTSLLFSIGKTLIGVYLGNSSVASAYGAAGSLILLLLWIYYSAQILFFGAEFTQVYANTLGSKILPEGHQQPEASHSVARRPSTAPRAGLGRGSLPVPTTGSPQEEQQAGQFARLLAGLAAASFVSGILTTLFGFKKR